MDRGVGGVWCCVMGGGCRLPSADVRCQDVAYQVFTGHFAYSDHADGVRWQLQRVRLSVVLVGREPTEGRRTLSSLGRHRVMSLQERLREREGRETTSTGVCV